MKKLSCLLLVLISLAGQREAHASNFVEGFSSSWGANLGWMDWRGGFGQGVSIDQFVCSGFLYAANVGWINLGDGVPLDGVAYQNNRADDFGVNVDTRGNLRGLAYGANIGWINFEQNGQPKVDLQTGRLSGFIYSANAGWIHLADLSWPVQIHSLEAGHDSDLDGIPDAWEITYANNLTSLTAEGDFDQDGHSDVAEALADTDPTDASDYLRIFSLKPSLDRTTVSLTWNTRPTRLYSLQVSASLEGGTAQWRDSGWGMIPAQGPNLTKQLPMQKTGQQFFRVLADRPLAP